MDEYLSCLAYLSTMCSNWGYMHPFLQQILKKLAFNGRHFNIMVIITTQDVKGIDVDVRVNADIVACTYQASDRAYITLKEEFANIVNDELYFLGKDAFSILFKQTPMIGIL
jgi:hypothetical protein